jgi:hypothetical protein
MIWIALALTVSGACPVQCKASENQNAQTEATVLEDVEVAVVRGSARVQPQRAYDAAAIDAFASWDISEVVARAIERAGDRHPPMIIINGQRVADPSIFLDFPPDAMIRLEMLPFEAGAIYGTEQGLRVVNLMMKPRYDSAALQLAHSRPIAGRTSETDLDLRRTSLTEGMATILSGRANRGTSLRADERVDYAPRRSSDGAMTLRPEIRLWSASLALTRPIGEWGGSLRLDALSTSQRSVFAFNHVAIRNQIATDSLALNVGAEGTLFGWQLQNAVAVSWNRTRQEGRSVDRQQSQLVTVNLSASRNLMSLASGEVQANLSSAHSQTWRQAKPSAISAESALADGAGSHTNLRGNLTLPLFRRQSQDGMGRLNLGEAMLNIGGNVTHSDAGGGRGLDLNLYWTPMARLTFNTGLSTVTVAPSFDQLFAPLTEGQTSTVYDFVAGQSVQVTPIFGGNSDLRTQRARIFSAGLTAGPTTQRQLFLSINYLKSDNRNGFAHLTEPTSALEAAFPSAFVRDADGRLIAIDRRPLNLAGSTAEAVSTSLSAHLPLGLDDDQIPQMISINLSHNYQLTDESRFGPGVPKLDRIAGVGGGRPGQTFQVTADTRRGRWALTGTALWQSAYDLRRAEQSGPDDLKVRALTTVDLRAALNLTLRTRSVPTASSPLARHSAVSQIVFEVQNVFDARPQARLAHGRPAPGYGADDRDPIGRSVRIQLAQRF